MPTKPEFICELPRYKRLQRLRKYYNSEQYEGRPDFFTGIKAGDSVPVPLRERKPCIIYPLPRASAHQVVRFTFGESRFPTISIDEIDATTAVVGEKLSADEAEELEKFIARLIDLCDVKPTMRKVMRPGISVGTSCAILSIKGGKFKIRIANAEDIEPTFEDNDPAQAVTAATWAYQFESTEPDEQGHPQPKRYWFRLDVTDKEFIEYKPVEVKPNEPVIWVEGQHTKHGLGFCPVLWCRNVAEEDHGDVDGQSLYDDLFDEFDALNMALSQRHRGINFWGVPQPWETGVDDDDGPGASGRTARADDGFSGGSKPKHGDMASRPARPIGPNNNWSYRNEKVKLGLLETTGKAFESASLHVNDIRSRCLEAMSVVLVNVSEIMGRSHQGQMSAKFLELAYEPLLALVDEMRHCWWPSGLRALLSMMLRMVAALDGKDIWIPGAADAAKILKRFEVNTNDGRVWLCPPLTASWGDYFSPDNDEIGKAVSAAQAAAGIVPDADRARFVLPYFDRHDTTDALEELEEELAEKQAAEEAKQALEHANAVALAQSTVKAGGTTVTEKAAQSGGQAPPKQPGAKPPSK